MKCKTCWKEIYYRPEPFCNEYCKDEYIEDNELEKLKNILWI